MVPFLLWFSIFFHFFLTYSPKFLLSDNSLYYMGPFLFRVDINRLNLYAKRSLFQFYDIMNVVCVLFSVWMYLWNCVRCVNGLLELGVSGFWVWAVQFVVHGKCLKKHENVYVYIQLWINRINRFCFIHFIMLYFITCMQA